MMSKTNSELPYSRLMLGTVQFGMPYGVANRTGQPSYRDVVEMIATAVEGGVNCFDTAAAYGESEAVLGRAIRELGIADEVTIVTKVMPVEIGDEHAPGIVERSISASIDESRSRLGRDCLDLVLFHRESDADYFHVLEDLKTAGKLKAYGVSCDNLAGPSLQFADNPLVSALQVPANIVDRRHQQSGIFPFAQQRHVSIFVRSVYLQGLLLMPEASVPTGLGAVLAVRKELTALAQQAGIQFGELCVRYMLSQQGVTSVIVGVETLDQVRSNVELFAKGPLPDDLFQRVNAVNFELPDDVITPSRWPQLSGSR